MRSVLAPGGALLAILSLAGCQSSNMLSRPNNAATSAETSDAPQIVTAKTAFWAMDTVAHSWASDAALLRLSAKSVPGFTNESGKAAMWEAVFASPGLHQYRLFTWSVAALPPQIYKGVSAGLAMPWGGATRDAMAIDTTQFTVDSDAAWHTASTLAADWLRKNPDKELSALELGETWRYAGPLWYVQWGDHTSGFSTMVAADSGKILNRK